MEALLVALIIALLWFLEKVGGTPMVIRPIVVSPLVGLALGDLQSGLLIGATLELAFMGAIQIGAAVPPDVLVGAGLGTAFAIMNHSGADVALTLALPIAIVAQSLKVIVFIIRSWFMDFAMKQAEKANIAGLHWINIGGLLLQCAMYFVVAYMAIALGSNAVEGLIAVIPAVIMNGLKVASGLLPAVGFALLLQPMLTGKNMIYFVLGFALIAYLGIPILGLTIIGVVIAYIVCFERDKEVVTKTEEEALFDE
ncbi:MAG: PTS mannose/fructose/sorbose/N-acetylgalactosamine transporter subunit IIC [Traorella sp.]